MNPEEMQKQVQEISPEERKVFECWERHLKERGSRISLAGISKELGLPPKKIKEIIFTHLEEFAFIGYLHGSKIYRRFNPGLLAKLTFSKEDDVLIALKAERLKHMVFFPYLGVLVRPPKQRRFHRK